MGWPLSSWPARSRGFADWARNISRPVAHRVRMYVPAFWKWALVALKRSDFTAGTAAARLECCRVMGSAHLYSRLAVRVERQRNAASVVRGKAKAVAKTPKKHSFGWVACFDEDAAKRIVALIKLRGETLFTHGESWYSSMLRGAGFGFTIKDMRRASLYWLGHDTSLNPIQLKNHARHKKLETTMLYCRRPDEDVERTLDLDI